MVLLSAPSTGEEVVRRWRQNPSTSQPHQALSLKAIPVHAGAKHQGRTGDFVQEGIHVLFTLISCSWVKLKLPCLLNSLSWVHNIPLSSFSNKSSPHPGSPRSPPDPNSHRCGVLTRKGTVSIFMYVIKVAALIFPFHLTLLFSLLVISTRRWFLPFPFFMI